MSAGSSDRDAAFWSEVEEATELLQEGAPTKALLNLRDVIKKSPENPYAYHYLGIALYEVGELGPARDAYKAAVRLSPDFLGARVGLSHVLRRLGDRTSAMAQAKEALRRFPKDGEAMHALGLAYAAQGKRALARRQLEGFLSTNPEFEAQQEVRQALEMLGLGPEGEPLEFDDEDA